MEKDLRLYLEAVASIAAETGLAPATHRIWDGLETTEPNADVTRMYPYVRDGGLRSEPEPEGES